MAKKSKNNLSNVRLFGIAIIVLAAIIVGGLYYIAGSGKCNLGLKYVQLNSNGFQCAGILENPQTFSDSIKLLKIITSNWNGWSQQQPLDTTEVIEINRVGQEIPLTGFTSSESSTLQVISYNENEFTLSTVAVGLKQGAELEQKGVNLNGCTNHTFTVKSQESVLLYTCTLDAGTTWTLTYY